MPRAISWSVVRGCRRYGGRIYPVIHGDKNDTIGSIDLARFDQSSRIVEYGTCFLTKGVPSPIYPNENRGASLTLITTSFSLLEYSFRGKDVQEQAVLGGSGIGRRCFRRGLCEVSLRGGKVEALTVQISWNEFRRDDCPCRQGLWTNSAN